MFVCQPLRGRARHPPEAIRGLMLVGWMARHVGGDGYCGGVGGCDKKRGLRPRGQGEALPREREREERGSASLDKAASRPKALSQ